jgi:hypothetical protein
LVNGERCGNDPVEGRLEDLHVVGALGEVVAPKIFEADRGGPRVREAKYLRESMRAALLNAGWAFLRASAVVGNGQSVLICGNESAGKTSAALALAAHRGWALLGNDHVFVRPDAGGRVRVLPWPAPVAVGLPLLNGLGWSGRVRTRLQAGQPPHPAQDARVTETLLSGRAGPVYAADRKLSPSSPRTASTTGSTSR